MIPKKIILENFFSYRELEFDFNFSSALLIGDSGSGKSTILEAVGWALFGNSRYKRADDVVKRGATFAKVIFYFEHDGKDYKIIRKRHSKHASQNLLEFYEIVNKKETLIPSDTNKELDGKIRDVVKSNYDVFINSSYFKQGQISNFLYGTSSSRQKLVSSILNLGRWDTYGELANSKVKEVNKELSVLKYKLDELADLEVRLKETESSLKKKKAALAELNSEERLLKDSIAAYESKMQNIKGESLAFNNYTEAVSKHRELSKKHSEVLESIEDKKAFVKKAKADINKNREAIVSIDEEVASLSQSLELKDKVDGLDEKKTKLHSLMADYNSLQAQITNLKNNDYCIACGHKHTDPAKKQAEIGRIASESHVLKQRIDKGKLVINKLQSYLDKISQTEVEIEKYISRKRNIENNINLLDLRVDSTNSEIEYLSKSRDELEKDVAHYSNVISELDGVEKNENYDDLEAELQGFKKRVDEITNIKSDLMYEVGALNSKLEGLESDKIKKGEVETEQAELKHKVGVYKSLVRSFSRNGIQAIIIDNVMEELTEVTNTCLNEFTYEPTYVEFVTQKKDSKDSWKETLDITIRTPSGISEFEGLSGGEQFRVAFSIRLALSHIQARRMGGETQLLMLDEVSTCLDPRGLEMFVSIIRKLEKDMKILVITHDEKLKEEFDHILSVRKQGDTSTISMI